MTIRLGCIADDFTGATDLANNLVRAGMRAGAARRRARAGRRPGGRRRRGRRRAQVAHHRPRRRGRQSLAACRWLKAGGATQIYFKVCSTFDSTPRGNIGPVLEALMDELDCRFTIATPGFPDNGRTVFKGHLFVGDVLLSDSGMRNHPLTPMTDANLVRVLQAQLATDARRGAAPRRVGWSTTAASGASSEAIRDALRGAAKDGVAIAIADAVDNDDLLRLGARVRTCRWSAPARASRSACRQLRLRRLQRVGGAAAGERLSRDRLGQLLGGDQRAGRALPRGGGAARGSIRSRSTDRDDALAERHRRAGPARVAARRSAGARLQHRAAAGGRRGAGQAGGARRRRAPRARSSPRSRARWSSAARAGSSSPAARPRAPACRRSASRGCASARRSIRACRGATRAPALAAEGLHLALKSGNFGGVDFFERAFAVTT
jgi:uncharacterized protein YgbK (DUF1537 family)